ncbi:signal recognition particle protein [bacterium]|nr:signal recognition particle protein [candidate division CSSED10-310 bacterium]
MFDSLADRLQGAFKKLRGQTRLTEKNITEALREVRMALLEADVNLMVVKNFVNRVKARAVGTEVMKSLTPGQQVIKIVNEELAALLGDKAEPIKLAARPPTIIMMVGLQGSGKTTSCAKLAKSFKKDGKDVMLVAADIYRPAAIDQLKTLGTQVGVEVFAMPPTMSPVKITTMAVDRARTSGKDIVILDTAGRLHIDERLMRELTEIKAKTNPHELLFVADAMTGQDAVNSAERFNAELGISGVILTKMDSDARGGAAISIKAVTGKPIKFLGVGEKLDPLEPFHPDRMASRILGMGDVLSLIEKAEAAISRESAIELQRKIREKEFTLEDFRDQLQRVRSMGPLEQIMGMIPGMRNALGGMSGMEPEKDLKKIEAIINSMTQSERRDHNVIHGSRRRRIAKGSGTSVADVNRLIKQFVQTRKMMRDMQQLQTGKMKKMFGKRGFPFM